MKWKQNVAICMLYQLKLKSHIINLYMKYCLRDWARSCKTNNKYSQGELRAVNESNGASRYDTLNRLATVLRKTARKSRTNGIPPPRM